MRFRSYLYEHVVTHAVTEKQTDLVHTDMQRLNGTKGLQHPQQRCKCRNQLLKNHAQPLGYCVTQANNLDNVQPSYKPTPCLPY